MAAHDLQRMNQSLQAMLSWLMLNRDYYTRLSQGEIKCVLVEGKTDQRLFMRSASDDTHIHAVGDILRSQDMLRQSYAARGMHAAPQPLYAKEAVINILTALKMADFMKAPKGASAWKVYGIIDSDYDSDGTTAVLSPNLFQTDTHDIETLLLMTDSALVLRILDGFFCEEDVKKAFTLAYQMARLRMATYDHAQKLSVSIQGQGSVPLWILARNRLRSMPDDDLSQFVKDDAIDVTRALAYMCGSSGDMSGDAGLPQNKLRVLTQNVLQDKTIRKCLDKDKTRWKVHWTTFKPDPDFYKITHGHDIARFLRHVTREKCTQLTEEQQNDIAHNLEFMMVDQYCLACLGQSNLGKSLIEKGIWIDAAD